MENFSEQASLIFFKEKTEETNEEIIIEHKSLIKIFMKKLNLNYKWQKKL